MNVPEPIASRDNPLLKRIRLALRDGAGYRRSGDVWLEGDHLIRAALTRGWTPRAVVWTAAGLRQWPAGQAIDTRHVQVTPELMRGLSTLETPAPVAALLAWDQPRALRPEQATVVLDRLQDPGNVGAILRSAAALGVGQVLALKGTVALWSPKVVRAGMGAHFKLNLLEQCEPSMLSALRVPMLATSSHQGEWLHEADLPWPCAWLFGHEGQGVDEALLAQAQFAVRIMQPGGEESLNVAAAAAICLHASAVAAARRGL